MMKMFAGIKRWELVVGISLLVFVGFMTTAVQRHAIKKAHRETMDDPRLYPKFISALVYAADEKCHGDVACHERWVGDDLPKFITTDQGYTAEDLVRVQSDVWYITSGREREDTINAMLPNGLREALMKSSSPQK